MDISIVIGGGITTEIGRSGKFGDDTSDLCLPGAQSVENCGLGCDLRFPVPAVMSEIL